MKSWNINYLQRYGYSLGGNAPCMDALVFQFHGIPDPCVFTVGKHGLFPSM